MTADESLRRAVDPRRCLVGGRSVPHALEDSHEEDIGRQLVDFQLHEDTTLGATEFPVGADDFFEALPAEGVLAGENLAGGVEPLEAHRALEEVVQHALVHAGCAFDPAIPGVILTRTTDGLSADLFAEETTAKHGQDLVENHLSVCESRDDVRDTSVGIGR